MHSSNAIFQSGISILYRDFSCWLFRREFKGRFAAVGYSLVDIGDSWHFEGCGLIRSAISFAKSNHVAEPDATVLIISDLKLLLKRWLWALRII